MRVAADLLSLCVVGGGSAPATPGAPLTPGGSAPSTPGGSAPSTPGPPPLSPQIEAVATVLRTLVEQSMRTLFQRAVGLVPQEQHTAQRWLDGVLKALEGELSSEAQFSSQLRPWLPAATAEAAAALWRGVQPLLQATLLSTTTLDSDGLRMLLALRDVRRLLGAMGVSVQMGLLPVFRNWLAQLSIGWQEEAAAAAAAAAATGSVGSPVAPLARSRPAALLAPLREGVERMLGGAAACDDPALLSHIRRALPRELAVAVSAFGHALLTEVSTHTHTRA